MTLPISILIFGALLIYIWGMGTTVIVNRYIYKKTGVCSCGNPEA